MNRSHIATFLGLSLEDLNEISPIRVQSEPKKSEPKSLESSVSIIKPKKRKSGGGRKIPSADELETAIGDYLLENPRSTSSELAEGTNIRKQRISKQLKEMTPYLTKSMDDKDPKRGLEFSLSEKGIQYFKV